MKGSPSPTNILPQLLRNLLTSLFIYADKPLLSLAEKYKLLHLLRHLLISTFLFLLRLLTSLFPSLDPFLDTYGYPLKPPKFDNYGSTTAGGGNDNISCGGDSGIARALSQLLLIVNDMPVSSRKYEVVRSLVDRIIDDNLVEGSDALREVNYTVLTVAFSRTVGQLEAAVRNQDRNRDGSSDEVIGLQALEEKVEIFHELNRFLRVILYYGYMKWTRFGKSRGELNRSESSAEKLAAEVLWLAQKMTACGCVEEAVCKWASATHLAWLALSAELRLQGSLVKVSAFLFKQAEDLGALEEGEESKKEQKIRQTKMKMLMLWLPLLCRASMGTDESVLSIRERVKLERTIESIIEGLEGEEEQEKVLSLWLHHFTLSPSSDWPNLQACYARWCTASRKLLLASPVKQSLSP